MYKILAKLGFPSNSVYYLPTCHSTNEIAVNMLANGLEEGTVVITDQQTDGKGQRGNSWEAQPFMNLTFSLVLRPYFLKLENQFRLTQAISIGLANVVQDEVSELVRIKWPNDIYVGNKKVAGILIQNSVKAKAFEASIVGIGLNVNQQEFDTENAISLRSSTGKVYDLNTVLNTLIEEISKNYDFLKREGHIQLNNEYQRLLYARNEARLFEAEKRFTGEILGTDPLGRLLVQTSEGVRSFQNQEVKLIGI